MLERGKLDRGVVEIVDTESLVPAEHLLRKIDAAVDFNRIYEMLPPLYSEDNGRPGVDPVVLFKMALIQPCTGCLPCGGRLKKSAQISVTAGFWDILSKRKRQHEETDQNSQICHHKPGRLQGIQERSKDLRKLSHQRASHAFQGLRQNRDAAYLEGLRGPGGRHLLYTEVPDKV